MSAPLQYRSDIGDWYDLEPGEFGYQRDDAGEIFTVCFWPHDSSCPLVAHVNGHRNARGATWTLSGLLECPTLKPSVDARDIWHGFLTEGVAAQ